MAEMAKGIARGALQTGNFTGPRESWQRFVGDTPTTAQSQSNNPLGANYKPPTGPQPSTVAAATGTDAATDSESESIEMRRRRQALILGSESDDERLGT